jgi:hypothetical protein
MIPPVATSISEGIALKPIRLPLGMIVETIQQRIKHVLEGYREKKRGRPIGWSTQMRQAFTEVSESLQSASDAQIQQEIAAYRATRRAHHRGL